MSIRNPPMPNISELIQYIVCYATQRDIKLTTVRLVKFIYLADLFYARANQGQMLTGLPWAFVYYGPYCNAVMQEIDKATASGLINKNSYESRFSDSKDYNIFTCNEADLEGLEDKFPIAVTSPLKDIIKRFGNDTAALLDFVYFETEPMIAAKPGEILDFSIAVPFKKPKEIKLKTLSKEKIELAKACIRKYGEELKKEKEKLRLDMIKEMKQRDEAYYQALEFWEEEDLEIGLEGIARIDI